MRKIDLSQPFIELIAETQQEAPASNLAAALSKVTAPLKSYAASLRLTLDQLSLFHICAGNDIHPLLDRHIGSLKLTDAYKGQHRSRLKSLIEALLRPERIDEQPASEHFTLEEQVPEPLRIVWPHLSRVRHKAPGRTHHVERERYLRERIAMALSPLGTCVALAILKICQRHNVSTCEQLFEEYFNQLVYAIKSDNHPSKWGTLVAELYDVRGRVRAALGYIVKVAESVTLTVDQLPEPLRTQVVLFQDRAIFGFKRDGHIKMLARTKYKVDLSKQKERTVTDYVKILCLGVSHLQPEMYGEKLDIRDFLRLIDRNVEVDEMIIKELYNPLVDHYRQLEQAKHSDRKESGFDSRCFGRFIWGIAAVAAFNGYLALRQLFLKEYKAVLDRDSKEQHKRAKKETFDRRWLDEQIQLLRIRFKRIAAEGTYKNEEGGTLRRASRFNLNLCLFYVALVTLRYLGVRQQCVRNCLLGINVIFGSPMTVTFYWSDKETKNAKGILHRLNMDLHAEVQEILIEAAYIYYKKIYPYLSGLAGTSQSLGVREVRRRAVAGQFFLKCNLKGICVPFTDERDFGRWFTSMTLTYMDFGTRLGKRGLWLNPHFLRAVFGDWCRFNLKYSGEQTALLAGDTEEVFEADYITHPATYDATDAWTEKCDELRAKRKGNEQKVKVKKA